MGRTSHMAVYVAAADLAVRAACREHVADLRAWAGSNGFGTGGAEGPPDSWPVLQLLAAGLRRGYRTAGVAALQRSLPFAGKTSVHHADARPAATRLQRGAACPSPPCKSR